MINEKVSYSFEYKNVFLLTKAVDSNHSITYTININFITHKFKITLLFGTGMVVGKESCFAFEKYYGFTNLINQK